MKVLRIFILIALVVSFMPLDAFCDDHHEPTEHHHSVVMCNASCHGAVLTTDNTLVSFPDLQSYLTPSINFIYEAPYLPTEYRPPITLS